MSASPVTRKSEESTLVTASLNSTNQEQDDNPISPEPNKRAVAVGGERSIM